MHIRSRKTETGYVPLDDGTLDSLRRFLQAHGDNAAEQVFGLNKLTLCRAAAGLGIQRASEIVIRQVLTTGGGQ
jgi:hypothetical protein